MSCKTRSRNGLQQKTRKDPGYRLHKASGQAFVELNGKRIYLGRYGTDDSRQRYYSTLARWRSNGCRLRVPGDDTTIVELCVSFLEWAQRYYVKAGRQTNSFDKVRDMTQAVSKLFGRTLIRDFSPGDLISVRQEYIDRGVTRGTCNERTQCVKRMFRWGVEQQMVPPNVLVGVEAVRGLRRGRCELQEGPGVRPVDEAVVEQTLPFLTATLQGMVRLQLHTGMRPQEAIACRLADLDMTGPVWVYKPAHHKTELHGKTRTVLIGPRGQEALRPFLGVATTEPIFKPSDSADERREARRLARRTPLSCGNREGTNRKENPQRRPGDTWTSSTYRRAVERACLQAFPPPDGLAGEELVAWRKDHVWTPNRLRHSFASRVRREFGLDVAQTMLGHSHARVTEIYAERDERRGVEVAARIG